MRFSKILFPVCLIFAAPVGELHAYLDPGTGSILLQGLIAAIATALATGKFWWHRVKSLFVKSNENNGEEETMDDSSN
jgi:hypothetical protein